MITCIINGHKAYPISTSSIKVTYANQYVTDDGEYTYDITFPMNILSNREIFKNVSRFEVKKKLAKYDDCKLYCNGLLIMSGVGTVLSVNQKEVKLQLLGGKSRVKYNSKFDKKFIDEMDLDRALHGSMGDQLETVNAKEIMGLMAEVKTFNFYATYNPSYMIGIPGMYVYTPIRDETNDMTANMTLGKNGKRYITNLAVHPNSFIYCIIFSIYVDIRLFVMISIKIHGMVYTSLLPISRMSFVMHFHTGQHILFWKSSANYSMREFISTKLSAR